MKCYHGTTKKGLKAITEQSDFKPNNPWSCCDNDGAMYVWPLNKMDDYQDKTNDYQDNPHEDAERQGIEQGFQSAQIQGAVSGDYDLYVIELEIPEELLEDDQSAENMADTASFIDMAEFNPEMIKATYHFKMNKWHSPYVIKALLDNPHFNKYSLDEDLMQIAEDLGDDCYIDSIYEYEYTKI